MKKKNQIRKGVSAIRKAGKSERMNQKTDFGC